MPASTGQSIFSPVTVLCIRLVRKSKWSCWVRQWSLHLKRSDRSKVLYFIYKLKIFHNTTLNQNFHSVHSDTACCKWEPALSTGICNTCSALKGYLKRILDGPWTVCYIFYCIFNTAPLTSGVFSSAILNHFHSLGSNLSSGLLTVYSFWNSCQNNSHI